MKKKQLVSSMAKACLDGFILKFRVNLSESQLEITLPLSVVVSQEQCASPHRRIL